GQGFFQYPLKVRHPCLVADVDRHAVEVVKPLQDSLIPLNDRVITLGGEFGSVDNLSLPAVPVPVFGDHLPGHQQGDVPVGGSPTVFGDEASTPRHRNLVAQEYGFVLRRMGDEGLLSRQGEFELTSQKLT